MVGTPPGHGLRPRRVYLPHGRRVHWLRTGPGSCLPRGAAAGPGRSLRRPRGRPGGARAVSARSACHGAESSACRRRRSHHPSKPSTLSNGASMRPKLPVALRPFGVVHVGVCVRVDGRLEGACTSTPSAPEHPPDPPLPCTCSTAAAARHASRTNSPRLGLLRGRPPRESRAPGPPGVFTRRRHAARRACCSPPSWCSRRSLRARRRPGPRPPGASGASPSSRLSGPRP